MKKQIFAPFFLFLAATAVWADDTTANASAQGTDAVKIQQQEVVRRQELVFRAMQAIRDGEQAEKDGLLIKAQEAYRFALTSLGQTPATQAAYDKAAADLVRVNIQLSDAAREKGDIAAYKSLMEEAQKVQPKNSEVESRLARLKKAEKNPNDTSFLPNEAVTPEFRKDVEAVQSLFIEAEQFRRTGQYDEAENRLKRILAMDPYNEGANKQLLKIGKEKMDYAQRARDENSQKRMTELEQKWSEPVHSDSFGNLQAVAPVAITRSNQFEINQKLKNIRLKSVEFSDATIDDAISFLNAKSKEEDLPDHVGVNFVVKQEARDTSRKFTLSLHDIPLSDALRYITQLANVKSKVEEFAVLVVPLAESTEVLLRRQFNVSPQFLSATRRANPTDTNDSARGRRTSPVITSDGGTAEVKDELMARGVEFPPGASAIYLPSSGILQVVNTQDQLDLIEELVNASNSQTLIVEVSAKLVEISQTDLNDLTLNASLINPLPTVSGLPVITSPSVTTALRGSQGFSVGSLDTLLGTSGAVNPNSLKLSGLLDGNSFNAVLTALAQKKSTDLLSSPTLRVKSGEDAKINVSRTFFYPTTFDPPQTVSHRQNGNNNSTTNIDGGPPTVIPAFPNEFESRDVGVRLTVKPQVGSDNRTIDLALFPEVTDFEGFINYGNPIFIQDADGNPVLLANNVINQPVFNTRRISTKVFVKDGYTVVLGGLMREDLQTIEDKVPLIGDIPLVGRLFRSKASRSIKRNLMIFVTARILRPDGELFNQPDSTAPVAAASN